MTNVASRFTLDGHQDLEDVTRALEAQGFDVSRGIVAGVARELLARLPDSADTQQTWELWAVMQGMVSAAEEEGLL